MSLNATQTTRTPLMSSSHGAESNMEKYVGSLQRSRSKPRKIRATTVDVGCSPPAFLKVPSYGLNGHSAPTKPAMNGPSSVGTDGAPRHGSGWGSVPKSFESGSSLSKSFESKPWAFWPPLKKVNTIGDPDWEEEAVRQRPNERVGDGLSDTGSFHSEFGRTASIDRDFEEAAVVVVAGQASTLQTLFNSINVLLGVGMLTVPFAISEGGWTAVMLLAILGVVTNYTGKLLWDLQLGSFPPYLREKEDSTFKGDSETQHLSSQVADIDDALYVVECPSYPDMGELAFGKCGRRLVGVVLYGELFSALVLFIILLGTNLIIVLPNVGLDVLDFMYISSAILLPLCWLRSMALLSWFSFLGVMSSISLVVSIVAYSFLGDCDGGSNCTNVEHPDPQSLNLTEGLIRDNLPMSLGLLMFCFAGHSVFPEILYAMKRTKDGPKVMNWTFIVVTALYVFLAIVGYLWLGISAPEQITQALPAGWVSLVVTWLLLASTYTKFALGFSPIAQAFEDIIPCFRKSNPKPLPCECTTRGRKICVGFYQVVARTVLVGLALIVAVTIPCFGPLSSLVGAILCCSISFILPSVMYLKVRWRHLSKCTISLNIIIVVFAIVAAVGGSIASVQDIVACLVEHHSTGGNSSASTLAVAHSL